MATDAVTLAVDPGAAPELALAAEGLAAGLRELGRACEVLVDPWPETLAGRESVVEVGAADARGARWRLGVGLGPDLELIDPSERTSSIPFPLPPLPRDRHRKPRILVIGGEGARRTRMMLKFFEALHAHSICDAVVWRGVPDEILRQHLAAEIHPRLRAEELARLLGSADALVEVSDEPVPEAMLLAAIGRAGGIPTVIHEALPGEPWEGRIEIREWSGEAFADAALAAAKRGRNENGAAAVRKDAAERLAGALFP